MTQDLDNWKTQIRKGYLELCLLLLIQKHKKLYGFELLEKMEAAQLSLREGTLYPILNRMTVDKILHAVWETQNLKGHPRKFYSLTSEGTSILEGITEEFEKMIRNYRSLKT